VYLSVAISKISTRENTLVDDGLFFVINARQLFSRKCANVCCVRVERVRYAQVLCLLGTFLMRRVEFACGCEMTKEGEGKNNTGVFMFRVCL
jgi:hypothetical protein